jgi:hypothetical protein
VEQCIIKFKKLLLITLAIMFTQPKIFQRCVWYTCRPTSYLNASKYKTGICQIYIGDRVT